MEYLHHSSVPATKSELELFAIPATQTAIESCYEVEFRPSATLDSTRTYDFQVPASEDFTDMSGTMIYVKCKLESGRNDQTFEETLELTENFGNTMFDQMDIQLGTTSITPSTNLYHYQAYLEDLLFRPPSELDRGFTPPTVAKNGKPFELYFRLHSAICQQTNLLINGIPILIRLNRGRDSFLYRSVGDHEYKLKLETIKIIIKRVRVFPDVQAGIAMGLEKVPAKYFITRNVVKSFSLTSGLGYSTIDNVFSGPLPKRMVVGFVSNSAFTGRNSVKPFVFNNNQITHLVSYVDGSQVPSIAYAPEFSEDLYMREFISLYRYMNQDEGIPQMKITYEEFKEKSCLFAFDYSPDGATGAESGTLSLVKRGNIRLDVRFKNALAHPLFVIVFAQFDNLIQIDRYRNVSVDY